MKEGEREGEGEKMEGRRGGADEGKERGSG